MAHPHPKIPKVLPPGEGGGGGGPFLDKLEKL